MKTISYILFTLFLPLISFGQNNNNINLKEYTFFDKMKMSIPKDFVIINIEKNEDFNTITINIESKDSIVGIKLLKRAEIELRLIENINKILSENNDNRAIDSSTYYIDEKLSNEVYFTICSGSFSPFKNKETWINYNTNIEGNQYQCSINFPSEKMNRYMILAEEIINSISYIK